MPRACLGWEMPEGLSKGRCPLWRLSAAGVRNWSRLHLQARCAPWQVFSSAGVDGDRLALASKPLGALASQCRALRYCLRVRCGHPSSGGLLGFCERHARAVYERVATARR